MPLREIRRFLVDGRVELLDEYAASLERGHRQRLEVLDYVRTVIEEAPMFEVKEKQVEPQRYVSKTTNVHVDGLSTFISGTIGELAAGGIDGPPFCVFHGTVNESDDGPVEVGVPRASGDRELAGGSVAFVSIDGSNSKFPEVLGAYDAIARWAKENGRDFAGSPREVYLSAPGEPEAWEVVWPLR